MGMIAQQVTVIASVLAACFLGPALAIAFLVIRKRRARARRRSPIGIDLLRGPGYTLREQLDEAVLGTMSDVFLLAMLPLMLFTVFLAQSHLRGLSEMMRLVPIYVFLAIGTIGLVIHKLLKTGTRLDRLKAGYDAELAVGQELDQLMRQGAATFHDVPADNFNIDHVVVSSEGVFAVETKGYTKPKRGRGKADVTVVFDGKTLTFPTWRTTEPLEQAERQAVWLAKWLSAAVGSPIRVTPVLALPGWFVQRTARGDVQVFSGKELAGLLRSREAPALSAQDIQRITHQVEQRCRTVAPLYVEGKKAS